MMNFFLLFAQFKLSWLIESGFLHVFFQFGVVRKSEDGWICLKSLLWM